MLQRNSKNLYSEHKGEGGGGSSTISNFELSSSLLRSSIIAIATGFDSGEEQNVVSARPCNVHNCY